MDIKYTHHNHHLWFRSHIKKTTGNSSTLPAIFFSIVLTSLLLFTTSQAQTKLLQVSEPPRAGGPIDGLTPEQIQNFNTGLLFFGVPHSVQGTEPGAPVNGLGATFNHNACLACHSHPGPGGTSPSLNPQVAIATQFGAKNKIPFFISPDGPIREARFIRNSDGTPDGSVHQLFSITGRNDAPGCIIEQPDFAAENKKGNLIFRIPSPIFGGGLVELIPEVDILTNMKSQAEAKKKLGIFGHENRSGNNGRITRFGWKAQNPSLEVFAGEAYNVEQGITNDLFPVKRAKTAVCNFNPVPEDTARFDVPSAFTGLNAVTAFTLFSKFLAPPQPGLETASSRNGKELFTKIGCALCHTPQLKTGPTTFAAFSNKPVNLFSDLIVHKMGPGLADHVTQGLAGPDEFRTSPLWGIGQRIFFLHDGRTTNLFTAIRAHASTSKSANCSSYGNSGQNQSAPDTGVACRSEANEVIQKFNRLSRNERQDIVNFLRTL
jgi:CxxC motif-containing protein (DUF1111 family)